MCCNHLLLLLFVDVVCQLGLLVARGGHPLVHVGARHLRRVRGVETGLKHGNDQSDRSCKIQYCFGKIKNSTFI